MYSYLQPDINKLSMKLICLIDVTVIGIRLLTICVTYLFMSFDIIDIIRDCMGVISLGHKCAVNCYHRNVTPIICN